jgi:mannosyltransferase OCH1-like enzyme
MLCLGVEWKVILNLKYIKIIFFYFFIFNISMLKSSKNIKKNINLIFLYKKQFKKHSATQKQTLKMIKNDLL